MHLGIVVDAQFGPLVLVAAGGAARGGLRRPPGRHPADQRRARPALIDRLRVSRVLDGVRGRPPVDRRALAEALSALSNLAMELGDVLDALDINPLIAGPSGCVAADALVVPARGAAAE